MANQTGRHFLQIPGPTPVPERILNAMSRQMLDHRGPAFGEFGLKLLADVKTIFKTVNPVIITPPPGRAHGRPVSSTRCRRATMCSSSRPGSLPSCGATWRSAWA